MSILSDFFQSRSDASHLEASEQEQLEKDFQEWEDEKSKDLEWCARPLVRYLTENRHPHTHAVVTQDTVEVCEGVEVIGIPDYIVD